MEFQVKNLIIIMLAAVCTFQTVEAGNPDRAGEAGAYELLINPWARSSGLYSLNTARTTGLEAMRVNVAGLAHVLKTEVVFTRSLWLQGSDINISAFGLAQKVGESNAIGISLMSMDFGEIERTTSLQPEGGVGVFKPSFLNIGIAYSRAFSNSIYAGMLVRVISERIDDVSASGIALDLGIQYVTGPTDNIRFGISLRNVGTPMKFGGDGLSFRGSDPNDGFLMTVEQRAEKFELPSQLMLGAAYDVWIGGGTKTDEDGNEIEKDADQRVTIVASFISNSFGKDQFGGGLEYAFRNYFMARVSYRYEDGITKAETRTSAYTGLAAGFSIMVPLKKDSDTALGIDYSYRATDPFSGTHSIGARFNL